MRISSIAAIAAVLQVLLVTAAPTFAAELEFKGLRPGLPLTDPENRFSCEDKKSAFADVRCHLRFSLRETIAGAPAELVIVYLIEEKISSISVLFKNENFDGIKLALQNKYGNGAVSHQTLTNRMGATFDNESVKWVNGSDSMTLQRYSGKIDTGSLEIHNAEAVEKFAERKRKLIIKNASDL